jgi:hypothetical protein
MKTDKTESTLRCEGGRFAARVNFDDCRALVDEWKTTVLVRMYDNKRQRCQVGQDARRSGITEVPDISRWIGTAG